jgi:hypothetical protein
MTDKIVFPNIPPAWWVFERDCVAFPAMRGERKITCLATLELLWERFGAREPSEAEAKRAYEINRPRLQAIARAQILAGNVSAENEVLLTTETFSLKEVTFSDRVRESPYYFRLARQVTAELEEVVGTAAVNTAVEWDRPSDAEGNVFYTLTVRAFGALRTIIFTPDQLEHSRDGRGSLYRLWGDLLQDRSHQQLQALLGAGQPEE